MSSTTTKTSRSSKDKPRWAQSLDSIAEDDAEAIASEQMSPTIGSEVTLNESRVDLQPPWIAKKMSRGYLMSERTPTYFSRVNPAFLRNWREKPCAWTPQLNSRDRIDATMATETKRSPGHMSNTTDGCLCREPPSKHRSYRPGEQDTLDANFADVRSGEFAPSQRSYPSATLSGRPRNTWLVLTKSSSIKRCDDQTSPDALYIDPDSYDRGPSSRSGSQLWEGYRDMSEMMGHSGWRDRRTSSVISDRAPYQGFRNRHHRPSCVERPPRWVPRAELSLLRRIAAE